ncbi:MAG: hypothetical protein Q9P14_09925 [candidate division KSB1 bacterium]|nr:hypothetical protein [candidate division KSB1 bacterium]
MALSTMVGGTQQVIHGTVTTGSPDFCAWSCAKKYARHRGIPAS